ncbi:hypothetical protein [Pseudomonas sp. Irchel s3h17]|uniref:hypothetical protein n=1 Tax=Pseudomonas sp. Irchel s3h17 TaxID=2009182 RepID=UPI00155F023C|nr:hypothetical protein [Pseudomonas sp. Irchel s3h17]
MKTSHDTKLIKVAMPLDLIALLEEEAKDYDSFTKMLNAVCRRYFIHQELKKEFAKIK